MKPYSPPGLPDDGSSGARGCDGGPSEREPQAVPAPQPCPDHELHPAHGFVETRVKSPPMRLSFLKQSINAAEDSGVVPRYIALCTHMHEDKKIGLLR